MFTEAFSFCSGGLVSHQSPAFQEEFPSLAPEEKGKETKKEEENKDTQYGPGPSLRPQSKLALLLYHEQILHSLGLTCEIQDGFISPLWEWLRHSPTFMEKHVWHLLQLPV